MQLAFAKKSLRQLCENETNAERDLGVKIAEKLKRRLADLRAATCVTDLVAGQPHEIKNSRQQYFVVELCGGTRLVFCPNHNDVPKLKSGDVDWSKVSRVKILRIENVHD